MNYKIIDIRARTKEVHGKRVPMIKVFYELETGYSSFIELPKYKFSEKVALRVIERDIKELSKLELKKEVTV